MIKKDPSNMIIITSYFDNEFYGVLGPQMAAAILEQGGIGRCVVVGVTRSDDQNRLKKCIDEIFQGRQPLIGFSTLSGRDDLFLLAKELRAQGAVTILAGPQAGADFIGEVEHKQYNHRFQGYHSHFDCALQGPAEQIIPIIKSQDQGDPLETPGLHTVKNNRFFHKSSEKWRSSWLKEVNWNALHRIGSTGLIPHPITTAQVLQQIGCPYAGKKRVVTLSAPAFMPDFHEISLDLTGCSFCDVAVDKGYCGRVNNNDVLSQIKGLPEDDQGRKIPFELINENPFPSLPKLLKDLETERLTISQINLTTRADYLLQGESLLREALKMARRMRVRIVCGSVGFESFNDRILHNLNKGISLDTNLKAVTLMRNLKQLFPFQWAYARKEGGNHGWIHPTPWDTPQVLADMEKVIKKFNLGIDILPPHSTPLIIHHASGLGDWIRLIEGETGTTFNRQGAIIQWWDKDDRFDD